MTHLNFPTHSLAERVADGVVHAVGIAAAIVGVVFLFIYAIPSGETLSITSLAIYGTALIALFCVSAAYHLTPASAAKAVLARFDQACIYLKIASTYTPFMLVKMAAWPGAGLLALVWSVATFGVLNKLLFPEHLKRTTYVLYLALGWCAVIVFAPLFAVLTTLSLVLLAVGGALYTIGVVFHLWPGLRFQNAIWHCFVLAGAACHYVAIMETVALA